MKEQNDITDELHQMGSVLASMSRSMPYMVPDGYFEGLGQSVIENIKACEADEPVLQLSKEMPFAVPQGYFNTLPDEMLELASLKEFSEVNTFSVPQGYFDKLPLELLNKVKATDQGPAVKRPRVIRMTGGLRWAAAAVLLLCLGFGSYRFLNRRPVNAEVALKKVPQINIKEYVKQNIDDFDADMIVGNMQGIDVHNVQVSSKQLDDQEIIQYLNETGWDSGKSEDVD